MTESERKRRIDEIRLMVHQKPDVNLYNKIELINNTNCYSYAIGSTSTYIQLHRIGAICGEKSIEEEYYSNGEIKHLLFEDLKVLGLHIEETSEEEQIKDNQYKIALFTKIYADNKIHDYHFLRYEGGEWSEKYRYQHFHIIGTNLGRRYYIWPWNSVGIFKITR